MYFLIILLNAVFATINLMIYAFKPDASAWSLVAGLFNAAVAVFVAWCWKQRQRSWVNE